MWKIIVFIFAIGNYTPQEVIISDNTFISAESCGKTAREAIDKFDRDTPQEVKDAYHFEIICAKMPEAEPMT